MKKNILVVDDSALMRRLMCDIIQSDERFHVEDTARDGLEAYELLKKKQYDAVILDINMPRMSGLELLEQLRRDGIRAQVVMASTLTKDGARETIKALELGAVDFVTKPGNFIEAKGTQFRELLGNVLVAAICEQKNLQTAAAQFRILQRRETPERKPVQPSQPLHPIRPLQPEVPASPVVGKTGSGSRVVAIACSTGGPKSLQSVLPYLPRNLDAPVLLVQHMPVGFTATLAERLNDLSAIKVKEAEDGEPLEKGCVYIAPGGRHLTCVRAGDRHRIALTDDPPRDALRPCANIMYESLMDCAFDEVTCVVLTGMGADGTKGIQQLETKKRIYVIAQDEATSVVYGMPRAVAQAGLTDRIVPLQAVANEITKNVGCTKWM